ncbi:phage capsid protein [Flavobacterium sp.]|uniref:phage capsid protein n=1 Tax=Flavobacterium sp. TaxID=239 RepID=UPI0026336760|nr:phage capsid protein [Flavobacterium sp.]
MANPKIPQEFWASYIVEKLRRTNPHIMLCFDESKYVKGGSVVYIPQAGAKPEVVKNRAFGAATAVQRGDSAIMYGLDVFTTTPTAITYAEANEISYEKTDSVLGDHTDTLAEQIGDELVYNWIKGVKPAVGGGTTIEYLPSSRQIPTSGAATAVNAEDGQTGTRKAMNYKEFQKMQAKFNKDNVPKQNRYAMLESYMQQEFLDSLSANQMAAFQASADLENGIVGKFAGFSILERSSVLALTSAGAFRVPGEALAATDNLASIFWQKDSVTKALGDTNLFQDMGNPLYYGDIHSGLVKLGGRCRREDWKGIGLVVQS